MSLAGLLSEAAPLYLPWEHFTGINNFEDSSCRFPDQECLDCRGPDLNSPCDWKILGDPRDNDRSAQIGSHRREFNVTRQKDKVIASKAVTNGGVGKTALPKGYYVLDVVAIRTQTVVEGKWKVLVEQDLQETCLTAGGRCAATWAA